AAVSAEVDDQLAYAALADVVERRTELCFRSRLEIRDLDVRDGAVALRRNRNRMELRRLNRVLVAMRLTAVQYLKHDRLAAAQRGADLPHGHLLRRLSVDLLDEVAALDARLRRRRIRD